MNPQIPPPGKSERPKAWWVFRLGKLELGKTWEQWGKDIGKVMLCSHPLGDRGPREGEWGWDG